MPRTRLKPPKLRFRLIVAEEYQPIQKVPVRILLTILVTVVVTMAAQIRISISLPTPTAAAIELFDPPSDIAMHALAVGDPVTFGKMSMLWLQAFDNQQGVSVSFHDLDYDQVVKWLRSILRLDPLSQYPLFSAARLYTFIKRPEKVRTMLLFIADEFKEDPARRWEWMATAATLAKNEVDDPALALVLARQLREHTEGVEGVPGWARQMEAFLLADNNEFDASADLLFKLIESGEVTDPQEFRLLFDRLGQIIVQMIVNNQIASADEFERIQVRYEELRTLYLKDKI